MKYAMLYIFFIASNLLIAQHRYDYVWPLGYGKIFFSSNGIVQGGIFMDFNKSPFQLSHHNFILKDPSAATCNTMGDLVAYSDGCDIANSINEIMLNGDTISPGEVFNEFCTNFPYPVYQGALFLPDPNSQ